MAMLLMGIEQNKDRVPENINLSKSRVIVSEFPMPGAICMPNYLSTILPIDRSFDEILENIGKDKLKFYHKYREHYQIRKVLDDEEIDNLDKTMFRPYATARYGENAAQLTLPEIKQMAKDTGILNLVCFNGKEVACHIGSEFSRWGKRYWRGSRAGFPEEVFSNSKLLNEANTMNYFLEIEWLIQNGFDYYDIDISLARPNDNVIQWKRRLRGHLDKLGNNTYFYVSPPKTNTSLFFWETPLFGLEKGIPTLHLGKPSEKSDEEFIKYIRQMGFGGLSIVYLHCEQSPSDNIISSIENLFINHKHLPHIKVCIEKN